jgi:hypothetical protein
MHLNEKSCDLPAARPRIDARASAAARMTELYVFRWLARLGARPVPLSFFPYPDLNCLIIIVRTVFRRPSSRFPAGRALSRASGETLAEIASAAVDISMISRLS